MAQKRKKFNSDKYTRHRRKQLKEELLLVKERDELTKQIRELRSEMRSWDRYLIHDGE